MRRSYLIAGMIVVFLACVGIQMVIFIQDSAPPEPAQLMFRRPANMQSKFVAPATGSPAKTAQEGGKVNLAEMIAGKVNIVGTLGFPLGSRLIIEGETVTQNAPEKTDASGTTVVSDHLFKIYRINEQWLSNPITVLLANVTAVPGPLGRNPRLPPNQFFRLVGYETAYIMPPKWPIGSGFTARDVASRDVTAEAEFVPLACEPIAKLVESVENAIGQNITIIGLARSEKGRAYVLDDNTMVLVDPLGPWPTDWEGKQITLQGMISKSTESADLIIEATIKELLLLNDQVGKPVRLRGLFWATESGSVFLYRGVPVHLASEWPASLQGMKVVIEGQLELVSSRESSGLPNFGLTSEKTYRMTAVKITPASNTDR